MHDSDAPLWQLFTIDAPRLLTRALVVALLLIAAGIVPMSANWLGAFHTDLSEQIVITVVLPESAVAEAEEGVRALLDADPHVLDRAEFGPATARERLEALGIDVDAIDAFAFQDQPRGHSFRWRGLAHSHEALEGLLRTLSGEHGTVAHFDRERLGDLRESHREIEGLLANVNRGILAALLVILAVASVAIGIPQFQSPLTQAELIQAVAIRTLAAALVGWAIAGLALATIAQIGENTSWVPVWIGEWWMVAVATALSPLGLIGRRAR